MHKFLIRITLLIASVLVLLGFFCASAEAFPESEHPYANNSRLIWSYTHPTDAPALRITFSSATEVQKDYDFLHITGSDGVRHEYTGTQLASATIIVPGQRFSIMLTANASITRYGFSITEIHGLNEEEYNEYRNSLRIKDFSVEVDGTLTGYSGSSRAVVIPQMIKGIRVTRIGEAAFNSQTQITSIDIPDGVTSIGAYAFDDCFMLSSITIPDSVTSIGASAFSDCSKLTILTIPQGITSIEAHTFSGCRSLTSIDIPEGVTRIGSFAFNNCSGLTTIILPEGITAIEYNTFSGCTNLKEIYIPEKVSFIGMGAFSRCSKLTEITLPKGLTSIELSAFSDCSSLESIQIPPSVTSIGKYAFSDCRSLASIVIPSSVQSISEYAFENCSKLKNIYVSDIESWLNLTLYGKDTNPLRNGAELFVGGELLVSLVIPEGITSIRQSAFLYCKSLKNVSIPGSVQTIGSEAFSRCTNLADVMIGEGVQKIGNGTFSYCINLESIIIPGSVTSVDKYAFEGCKKISKVVMTGDNVPEFADSLPFQKSTAVIYCYEYSSVDFWASEKGYRCVYIDRKKPEMLKLSSDLLLYPGEEAGVSISTLPLNAEMYDISWESSDCEVAVVENGVVKAVSVGSAKITASCAGIADQITVTVLSDRTPKSLVLSENLLLYAGETAIAEIETAPLGASEYDVVWESSDEDVALIENGVVTAISAGTATVTASCGNVADSMEVTVYVRIEHFELSEKEIWVVSKNSVPLTVTSVFPVNASGYTFTMNTSDESIVAVDADVLYAKIPGDAIVTVVSDNGIVQECLVHVCYPVTEIALSVDEISMQIDSEMQLIADVTMNTQKCKNQLVSFTSSDETVLTVDQSGWIKAIGEGEAVITVFSESGVTANCVVVVKGCTHDEGKWIVVTEPTYESEGLKERRCTACEAVLESEIIPRLEEARVPGDASGDGVVDGRDLIRLAKYLGGYDVEIDAAAASVNGDDVVDGRDLIRLAKFLGRFDVELK